MRRLLSPIITGALLIGGLIAVPALSAQATSATIVVHVQGVTADATTGVPATANDTLSINGSAVTNYSGSDDFGALVVTQATAGAPVTFAVGTNTFNGYDLTNGTEIWLGAGLKDAYPTEAQALGGLLVHVPSGAGAPGVSGDNSGAPVAAGTDTYGDVYRVPLIANAGLVDVTYPGEAAAHSVSVLHWGQIWLKPTDATTYLTRNWADGFAIIHYHRPGGDYTGYGLHMWTGYRNDPSQGDPTLDWGHPFPATGTDPWGSYFKVPLAAGATDLMWIMHNGDTKDPGPDQDLNLAKTGGNVWFTQGTQDVDGHVVFDVPVIHSVDADLTKARAVWLDSHTLAWPFSQVSVAQTYTLYYSATGGITVKNGQISGGTPVQLTYQAGLGNANVVNYPYLSSYSRLVLPDTVTDNDVKSMLKGQVVIATTATDGISLEHVTGVQVGPVLDSLYSYNGALGTTFTHDPMGAVTNINISVWAPTATSMQLLHFADSSAADPVDTVDMTLDPATGVWSYDAPASWLGSYYLYKAHVYVPSTQAFQDNITTDPYSQGLSTNSARTLIVDLTQPDTKPAGWDTLVKPKFASLADASIYELHIRDFSAYDQSVPAVDRGTYEAFTQTSSNGMKHLAALAKAGLTHVHILPFFDITSINEDPTARNEVPQSTLQGYITSDGKASTKPAADVSANASKDAYNWGYDPYHYTTPEGSYSTNPDGSTRNKETRDMVQGLNKIGLRVVMDVVYNHTSDSGQNPHSVLDKLVPGYYYRLKTDGTVLGDSCCQDTATERTMMGKLVRDSVLTWATAYKIDGFRFDIMGMMPKALLTSIRSDLNKLTVAKDGVDGKKILMYGEGWNYGAVANNARFIQATQVNMAGTGIGTFDDRLRDAVRGGGPFDSNPRIQGFGSGLYTLSNKDAVNGSSSAQKASLLSSMDAVKLGMAGEEANYSFVDSTGTRVSGLDVNYNNNSAGYTSNPVDQISYVDAHDGTILFDSLAYKLPYTTSPAVRARYQVVSLATTLLGQGVPFMAAGSDLLHSKSLDTNSYDSGDWFNSIDWTGTDNGFGHGVPINTFDATKYASPALTTVVKPSAANANLTSKMVQDLLKLRYSSPLFRLGTLKNVQQRVTYIGSGAKQTPGVITMRLLDAGAVGANKKLANLDKNYKSIIVVINASAKTQIVTSSVFKKSKISLDPIQAKGSDSIVKHSKYNYNAGSLTVPAQTVAVFVQK